MQIVVIDIENMVEVKQFETAPGDNIPGIRIDEIVDGMFQDSLLQRNIKDVLYWDDWGGVCDAGNRPSVIE